MLSQDADTIRFLCLAM